MKDMLSDETFPETGDETSPLRRVYPCRYGCGFSGSPQELSAHYRRDHKEDRETTGREEGPPEAPTPRRRPVSPIEDLIGEIPNLKSAIEFSRWKQRLQATDPSLYKVFFPTGHEEAGPMSKLVDLEVLRAVRAMNQEYMGSKPMGPSLEAQQLMQLRDEFKELQEKLEVEREKRLYDKIEALERALEGLKGSTSDLQYIVGKATDFLDRWVAQGGGPGAEVLLGALGYQKIPLEPPPPVENVHRPNLDELAKEGLVVNVKRDRNE